MKLEQDYIYWKLDENRSKKLEYLSKEYKLIINIM